MTRRFARHIPMVLLGLLAGAGCAGLAHHSHTDQFDDDAPCQSCAKPQDSAPGETASLCLALAHKLEQDGLDAEAARQYELARRYQPQADVAHHLAVLYDRLGSPGLAAAEYERAVEAHPQDADLLNDLGYYHYTHGKWELAEQYLRRAVASNPQHQRAWTNLGMALAQQGHTKESLEAFKHSVSPGQAEYNLGFLLAERGKWDEALVAYREAVRLEPGLTAAKEVLARLEAKGSSADAPAHDDHKKHPDPAFASGGAGPALDAPAAVAQKADVPSPAAPPHSPAGEPDRATEEPRVATVLTAATQPTTSPLPPDAPDRLRAGHWVIPTGSDPAGAKAAPVGTVTAAAPVPPAEPYTVGIILPAASGAPAEQATIHWVPPPPVPQHGLPPDLVPCKAEAAHGGGKAAPAVLHADESPATPPAPGPEPPPQPAPSAAPPMPAATLPPGTGAPP